MPRRLYVPLSVQFFDDDRIIACSDGAQLLYLSMLCWAKSNHSDGRVTLGQMTRLHRARWRPEVAELVKVEAVAYLDDLRAYQIIAWFEWNTPSEAINDKRVADRERKRLMRVGGRTPDGRRTDSV